MIISEYFVFNVGAREKHRSSDLSKYAKIQGKKYKHIWRRYDGYETKIALVTIAITYIILQKYIH